jgi:hypothetical protein
LEIRRLVTAAKVTRHDMVNAQVNIRLFCVKAVRHISGARASVFYLVTRQPTRRATQQIRVHDSPPVGAVDAVVAGHHAPPLARLVAAILHSMSQNFRACHIATVPPRARLILFAQ